MYLCRQYTETSLQEVGQHLGKKDHTTVIHACDKIEKDIKADKNLRDIIDQIKEEIKE